MGRKEKTMLIIDNDGTITLYQGDSGEITVSGLDSTKNLTVYFAIQDGKRNIVGTELEVASVTNGTATFVLESNYTNLLTVPKNKPYQIYYYGIKVCESDSTQKDTLFIGEGTYGDLNRIIVYPRKVKGDINE